VALRPPPQRPAPRSPAHLQPLQPGGALNPRQSRLPLKHSGVSAEGTPPAAPWGGGTHGSARLADARGALVPFGPGCARDAHHLREVPMRSGTGLAGVSLQRREHRRGGRDGRGVEGVGDAMAMGCGAPCKHGGLTFSPLGPAGPLMPGSPDSPGRPVAPGVPGSPGLPASPWQSEGTRLARGGGAHGNPSPFCHPQPRRSPLPSPSHLLSLLASVAGSALGKGGGGQARASPETGAHERGGHSPLCPGGRPGPSPPGVRAQPAPSLPLRGPAAPEDTARTARPAEGTSRWLRGPQHCGVGGRSPRCPPQLSAVPCNELRGSQLERFHARGSEWGPGGSPSQGSPSLL